MKGEKYEEMNDEKYEQVTNEGLMKGLEKENGKNGRWRDERHQQRLLKVGVTFLVISRY